MIVLSSLLIACGNPAERFEAVDQARDATPQAVDPPIKGAGPVLTAFAQDGETDATLPQVRADRPTAIALIANESTGTALGASWAAPFEGPLFHERVTQVIAPLTGDRLG
jgi:hypothetical protein